MVKTQKLIQFVDFAKKVYKVRKFREPWLGKVSNFGQIQELSKFSSKTSC